MMVMADRLWRGTPHGVMPALLSGTIEGTKKSIAAINIVLTILRRFIWRPIDISPALNRHSPDDMRSRCLPWTSLSMPTMWAVGKVAGQSNYLQGCCGFITGRIDPSWSLFDVRFSPESRHR
jgi:hypothetical protein